MDNTKQESSDYSIDEIGKKLAGKYLTFSLNSEEYAIEILRVNQIILMQEITSIPCTPPFIRGVINLRGMIIPIIDLHKKFSMSEHTDTERTCIVVVQLDFSNKKINMGVVIDEVREVLEIPAADIERTPEFGTGINMEFIMGIAKTGKNVKILLDINKVLTSNELKAISNLSGKDENAAS